jgi:anti-sigma B factor antagonist
MWVWSGERVSGGGRLGVEQLVDQDGSTLLQLTGELDHETSTVLVDRLGAMKAARQPVRLDLSGLEFIDSSGVRTLIVTVRDASEAGWRLEIRRELSWQVERVVDVLGIEPVLWPGDRDRPNGGG